MWLGARRAGTIANALGRNWMVTEQRKAGEGSVCGRNHAHIAGTQLPGTWLVAPRTVSLLQRSVSRLDEWDLGSLEFTSLWDGSLVIR